MGYCFSKDFLTLLTEARAGTRPALDEIFVFAEVVVRRGVSRMHERDLHGECQTEDIGQDALVKAIRRFQLFRGSSQGEFVSWLRVILKNTRRDHLRRHRREEVSANLAGIAAAYGGELRPGLAYHGVAPDLVAEFEECQRDGLCLYLYLPRPLRADFADADVAGAILPADCHDSESKRRFRSPTLQPGRPGNLRFLDRPRAPTSPCKRWLGGCSRKILPICR